MGTVEITNEKPFSGNVSLKVTPDAGDNPRIERLDATISDQPKLGQYRYVLFAWKQATGNRVQIQFANDGRLGEQIAQIGLRADQLRGKPVRARSRFEGPPEDRGLRHGFAYDAGSQPQTAGAPLRLFGAMPKDWQLQMRDLYGDFGQFNLTGLALSCVGGEAAGASSLAPKVGPLGLSAKKIGDDIAKETLQFKGLRVTVKLTVQNRVAQIEIVPTTATLLVKHLNEPERDRKKVKNIKHSGNLTMDMILNVANRMRFKSMARTMHGTIMEVLGTANSIGCTVDGKKPKQIQKIFNCSYRIMPLVISLLSLPIFISNFANKHAA